MKNGFYKEYTALNKLEKKTNELYHHIAVRLGISDSVFWTLYSIYESHEVLTQNDIAEGMGYPKQTVHSAISRLVKEGYVYMQQKAGERNTKTVHLSDDGKVFCDTYIQPVMNTEVTAVERLTDEEIEQFLSTGKKMYLFLQQELTQHLRTMEGKVK